MNYLAAILLLITNANPDPKAKAILDKVHEVYNKATSMEINFTYEQSNSDIVGLMKKGSLSSKSEKFKLILDELEIYSDGKTQYTFLKKNKEVQITQADEKENKYHPKRLAEIYQSGTHEYSIAKKNKEKGKTIIEIDFIPIDKKDPLAEIKLFVIDKSYQIERVEWNERKGDKTKVRFVKSQFNKSIADSEFVLDTKNIKDVHVEDLRD